MTKRRKRAISKSHCFFWRWHHLPSLFIACLAFGFTAALVTAVVPKTDVAHASISQNVMGWAWTDPGGWISLNDANPNSGGGSYGVNIDLATGELTGFGWSENVGWVCFGSSCTIAECPGAVPAANPPYNVPFAKMDPGPYQAGASIRAVHGWAKVCSLGAEGWISLNCSDISPSACGAYPYHIAFDMTTHAFTDDTAPGSPGNGTSFGWNGNADFAGLGYVDFRSAYLQPASEQTDAECADGIDNDLDSAMDCADTGCAAVPHCAPPPQDLREDQCPLGTADLCCKDTTDNEGDGVVDCADSDCQANSSICTVSWLKTRFGNVYAQKGIDAVAAPAQQFNASYCLSLTDGSIVGFESQLNCTVTNAALSLPTQSSKYRGSLGSIDVAGISAGRYGAVVSIADGNALPESLGGRVYEYSGGGTLTLPTKNFVNAAGASGRGNGLLLVNGADLRIIGDLTYGSNLVDATLRNLASLGVIVTAKDGVGGHLIIDPAVTHFVGAYFAETSISTGDSTSPLEIFGLMATKQFAFERSAGTSSTASETVTFDGRALANPPPGMQDIGKSLPKTKEAF